MSTPRSKKEYEELGRIVANIYESGYADKATTYKMSFIKGLLAGFGGVIGATIVIALLLWVLTWFKNVPLVGRFSERTRETIQQAQ